VIWKTLEENYSLVEVLEFIDIDLENNAQAIKRFEDCGVAQHVVDRAVDTRKQLTAYKESLLKRIGEK